MWIGSLRLWLAISWMHRLHYWVLLPLTDLPDLGDLLGDGVRLQRIELRDLGVAQGPAKEPNLIQDALH